MPPVSLTTVSIDSERLTLRPITDADFAFFARVHADPDVARYLGHGKPRTIEESRDWLVRTIDWYDRICRGALAVVRRSDGVLLGRCGITHVEVERNPAPGAVRQAFYGPGSAPAGMDVETEDELGYTFAPEHWGQGYASEAAAAMFAFGRGTLGLRRIISLIHPENARSIRLATKKGAERTDRVTMMGLEYDRFVWP
jgi:ribosomal-protein-alanine N-acetyltransferase